jgi:hypothetical protein
MEDKIREIMIPIHKRILENKYVSFGTLMRAGLKIAKYSKEETLDENGILHGKDAINFLEEIKKNEIGKLNKFEKQLIKDIKKNYKYFNVDKLQDFDLFSGKGRVRGKYDNIGLIEPIKKSKFIEEINYIKSLK